MQETLVADAMTEPVLTVDPDEAMEQIAEAMLAEEINSVVIIDDDCEPAEILTGTDYIQHAASSPTESETPVREYMTTDIVSIGPGATIGEAAARMIEHGISHVPVVDDGNVVGIMSVTDLTEYVADGLEAT